MRKILSQIFAPNPMHGLIKNHEPLQAYLNAYRQIETGVIGKPLTDLHDYHYRLDPSLHRGAEAPGIVAPAILYAAARLPGCMAMIGHVFLIPDSNHLPEIGLGTKWREVKAKARKRSAYFNGRDTIAFVMTSITDIDDLIPTLCAYQIEWNKMHQMLSRKHFGALKSKSHFPDPGTDIESIRKALEMRHADFCALREILEENWNGFVASMASGHKDLQLTILPMTESDFQQAACKWWDHLMEGTSGMDLQNRPVYLVSSNTHSMANLISGFGLEQESRVLHAASAMPGARAKKALKRLKWASGQSRQNLIYYLLQILEETETEFAKERLKAEHDAGIIRLPVTAPLLLEAQIFKLSRFSRKDATAAIFPAANPGLNKSRAVIVNIDYPLGLAASHLIYEAGKRLKKWRGLFVLGKSAAMIGRLGDILIPSEVLDIHTESFFSFHNCMGPRQLAPFLEKIAVFCQQRSFTTHGTFLHGWKTVKGYIKNDFTGIEMEAGPIMASLYRLFHGKPPEPGRCLKICLPPELSLGLMHYTSDTPYNLRASLLSQCLGINGLEATYAASMAILQHILTLETRRLK